MTIKKAMINVIEEHGNNMTIQTYDLKRLVVSEMRKEENRNPMSATMLRVLRSLRTEGYTVECLSTNKSIYHIQKNV